MTRAQLQTRLARRTGRKFVITLTNNRHRVLTYRPSRRGPGVLRLSRIFLSADAVVLSALADFIAGSRRAKRILQIFVDHETDRLNRRRARLGVPVQTDGACYDLQAIFDRLNYRYFGGGVDAYITWGRRHALPGKRTVQLGTYSESERLIRINPVLDQAVVPSHVIEKVIFHEMLHHVLQPAASQTRRCLHGKEFNEKERRFAHYDRAERWLQQNLRVVLA